MEKKILKFYVDNMFQEGTKHLPNRFSFRMKVDETMFDEAYCVWDGSGCSLNSHETNWEGHEALFKTINETAVYCLNQMLENRDPNLPKSTIDDVIWELHPETEEQFNWTL